MTIADASDLVIGLGAVCGALMLIGALLWRVVVRPLRKSMSEELQPVVNKLDKLEIKQNALDTRVTDHIMTHRNVPETH